jgi:hypothetical protein
MRLAVRLQRLQLAIPTQVLARLGTVEGQARWLAEKRAREKEEGK